MALLHLDFESEFMGSNQSVYIILPDKPRDKTPAEFYGEKKFKVLWLLHGTFGGYSDWIRKSNIELYACEKDLIVVMPGIGNSDYEEWKNFTIGLDSDRYIVDELMPMVYNWFPASSKREDNFIAGLSMGGGGALHFALKYPEKFSACASLSYCPRDMDSRAAELEKTFAMSKKEVYETTDIMHSLQREYNRMHRYDSVEEYLNSDSNLYRLLENAEDEDIPALMFACGTEDPLMTKAYEDLKEHFAKTGRKAYFTEGPGSHEWRVWERDIQKAFVFFHLSDEISGNAF